MLRRNLIFRVVRLGRVMKDQWEKQTGKRRKGHLIGLMKAIIKGMNEKIYSKKTGEKAHVQTGRMAGDREK